MAATSSISIMAILMLSLLVMFLASYVIVSLILTIGPRTRAVGMAMLAVPTAAVILLVLYVMLFSVRTIDHHQEARVRHAEVVAERESHGDVMRSRQRAARLGGEEAPGVQVAEVTAEPSAPVGEAEPLVEDDEGTAAVEDTNEAAEGEEATGGEVAADAPAGHEGGEEIDLGDDADRSDAEEVAAESTESDGDVPPWVYQEPFVDGGVYKAPIRVGPLETVPECRARLPEVAQTAVRSYLVEQLAVERSQVQDIRISEAWLLNHMIGEDTYVEPVRVDFGDWQQLHALVKFDGDTRSRLKAVVLAKRRTDNLLMTLLVFGGGVGVLGLSVGTIKVIGHRQKRCGHGDSSSGSASWGRRGVQFLIVAVVVGVVILLILAI